MKEKWFQLIMGDENRKEPSLFVAATDSNIDVYELKQGSPVKNWNPKTKLESEAKEEDGAPDALLGNDMMLPIFSKDLRSELTGADVGTKDIQHLPVTVVDSTGKPFDGFTIGNVTSRLPALDYQNSVMLDLNEKEIDPLTKRPKVRSVWTPAISLAVVGGHDIIRLTEFFPPVLVSERFERLFTRKKFTGATFKAVRCM